MRVGGCEVDEFVGLRVRCFSPIMLGSTGSLSQWSMGLGCHGRIRVGVVPGAVRGQLLGQCGGVEWVWCWRVDEVV